MRTQPFYSGITMLSGREGNWRVDYYHSREAAEAALSTKEPDGYCYIVETSPGIFRVATRVS